MANHLSFALLLIFFSASCALVTAVQETEQTNRQDPPAGVVENSVAATESIALTESSNAGPEVEEPTRAAIHSLSRNEVRRVQMALKENNFDPGAVDGILGPRTKEAFRRLQVSCSKLQDIAEISAPGNSPPGSGAGSSSLSEPVKSTLSNERVQHIQVKLKQAGFNPGPVDGKLGPRTSSALLRARSACSLANQFRVTEAENFTAAENSEFPMVASKPVKDTTATTTYRSSDSSGRENSAVSLTADKIVGVDEIKLVQVQLKEAGFDPGPIDGVIGPRTRSALQQYRAANGVRNLPVRAVGIGSRKEY